MFQVGDVCVVVSWPTNPNRVGQECVIAGIGTCCAGNLTVDFGPNDRGCCPPIRVRKKPPYDGNVKTSWSDLIVWEPKRTSVPDKVT